MTAEEFEAWWIELAGMTRELFDDEQMRAVPCDCEHTDCQGWKIESFWGIAIEASVRAAMKMLER